MISQKYDQIYDLLRKYSIGLSVEKGLIFLSSDDELLAVRKDSKNKVKVFYQTLDSKFALRTLEGCPKSIQPWYEELKKIIPNVQIPKIKKLYEPVVSFTSTFSIEEAMMSCSYLASKIVYNKIYTDKQTGTELFC